MRHEFLGFCQVCCKMHAVNVKTGLLAVHGYTLRWGEFTGECYGSKNLPFQKSCELVKKDIIFRKEQLAGMEGVLARLQSDDFFPLWKMETETHGALKGHQITKRKYLMHFVSEHQIESCRKSNIWEQESNIRAIKNHIAWQERRVRDWTLKPLIPETVIAQAKVRKTEAEKAAKQAAKQAKIQAKADRETARKARNVWMVGEADRARAKALKIIESHTKVGLDTPDAVNGWAWIKTAEELDAWFIDNKDTGRIKVYAPKIVVF